MTAQKTPMIQVEKIVVEEGLNARKSMDQEALKRLGKSIAKDELVQPITVRPIEDGKFALIAGERRYEAAKLEGIKELPGHVVTSGNRRTISFIENLHREDLNKIEEAEGLEDLAKELKLGNNKAVAEEVGMSQTWVSSRRRLLKLPEKVQQAIARDEVPIEAASLLIKVAAASPRIAERVCEVYKTDEAFSDFVRDFTLLGELRLWELPGGFVRAGGMGDGFPTDLLNLTGASRIPQPALAPAESAHSADGW
jgi:ParB/RepB/Spo0J family partition protein